MVTFLPTLPNARLARDYVGSTVADHDQPLAETVVLLANELAVNAIVHTGQPFEVDVQFDGDGVQVVVSDQSKVGLIEPCAPEPGSTGGRGLLLVDGLADSWGWRPTSGGKQVWFRVDY